MGSQFTDFIYVIQEILCSIKSKSITLIARFISSITKVLSALFANTAPPVKNRIPLISSINGEDA